MRRRLLFTKGRELAWREPGRLPWVQGMGIYDRGYYREETSAGFGGGPRSLVVNLIIINVGIFLANVLLLDNRLNGWMALSSDIFTRPWNAWQLLTYGFAHDDEKFAHIFLNMFALFIFGRDVEGIYGKQRFLQLYLSLIICSGLVWAILESLSPGPASMIGASGAIMGILVIYVMHYPRRTFYVYAILPVPAWLLLGLYLLLDLSGAVSPGESRVAFTAHLAGAAFGFLFYKTGFQLGGLLPQDFSGFFKRRPHLRVHRGSDSSPKENLSEEVDRILEKISRSGEASLTSRERDTLENASRRYQQRRQ